MHHFASVACNPWGYSWWSQSVASVVQRLHHLQALSIALPRVQGQDENPSFALAIGLSPARHACEAQPYLWESLTCS